MKFRRFTKTHFLKQIGRSLLDRFFAKFATELTARQVELPAATLADEEYFTALAKVVLAPDGLPEGLIEAFANIYKNFTHAVRAANEGSAIPTHDFEFATVHDGWRGMVFIDAVVESSTSDTKWIHLTNYL